MQAAEIRAIVAETLTAHQAAQSVSPVADVGEIVEKAIGAALMTFGIEADDRQEMRADLAHLRKWRKSVEAAESLTFKVVLGTIVSGLVGAVWMGFKIFVGK